MQAALFGYYPHFLEHKEPFYAHGARSRKKNLLLFFTLVL